ncbi:MAG: NAD(P)H-hydrate dehydratase [Rickettsiales bacterium]|nr:NAD(P)H-hydrate dehydratase [Rickettsiales bacterium]
MLSEATTATILTSAGMRDAEARAIESGAITGWEMMQRGGEAVAEIITLSYQMMPVTVLCGPGNNGGDGFVTAAALQRSGWLVEVGCLVEPDALQGDAKRAAEAWGGIILPLEDITITRETLVVDALFGTGFNPPLSQEIITLFEQIALQGAPLIAIDLLSGLQAETGFFEGLLPNAAITVTFGAKKPAHMLMPATLLCGVVACVDIGISAHVDDVGRSLQIYENRPELWLSHFHWPQPGDHKYLRGSLVVLSGPKRMTGASRLAAQAALRAGAGVVTLAADGEAIDIHAAHVTAIMVHEANSPQEFADFIAQIQHKAVVLGPGAGITQHTRECVLAALATGKPTVLDADALSVFEGDAQTLFDAVRGPVIMTPHSGELQRLFATNGLNEDQPKWALAREVAQRSGMVCVLKGYDTVIASPDGRVVISNNGSPLLATAGSGDALAGIIGGLCAQGLPAFEAACAGVSLHAEAARRFGLGLIAEDLPDMLPAVLNDLWQL